MGMETALLFCAIRAAETLGTLAFSRDTRAGYEMALCMRPEGYSLSTFCLNAPALALDVTGNPARFGSVAICMFQKAEPKVRNKIRARLDAEH